MFGRKKSEQPTGPYKVEAVAGNSPLEKLLNKRHAEGYELVTILQGQAWGANFGRDVVFKHRSAS
ncbi:MAG: hypothetical protein M3N45_02385 [Actinomycetota bacterium]|nr:hypothetical protein [Actinomycetota bacterium]